MSLDLYIESKTPVLHRGTGVCIRENGENRELKTKQEVLTYFPDMDPDKIKETTYEDNDYFHINITRNLTKMAEECNVIGICNYDAESAVVTLYDLMWHPKEKLKVTTPTLDYLTDLIGCYKKLLEEPEFFRQFNPENGWGSYEGLVKKVKAYMEALTAISDEFDNYTITADT